VQTLAEGLHLELASLGVDVVASAPGPVRSGFEARANMRMTAAVEPDEVARGTLDALGCRTTAVPGLLSKVLSYSLAPLPRPMRSRIMRRVMGDMTRHQRDTVATV
jgi:short-subunit dehydrogenase